MWRGKVSGVNRYIFIKRLIRSAGLAASVLLVLLAILATFPIIDNVEEVEAAYTPAISTVTITSATTNASIDITPTNKDGTFVTTTTSSEVVFGVTTNNLTGYTIAVAARSGDTSGQLTNASYGDVLDTIASPVNEATFATGAASTYANKWGLKSSKYNTSTSTWDSLASGNYLPAPKTSNTVLDTTSSPNSTPIQYRVGIGARVDYIKTAGTYTNTYILQAVGNQISYQINYLDNSSGSNINVFTPEAESNITASSFTLNSATPTKTGYDFIGWCDGNVTHNTSGTDTCAAGTTTPGTVYQAGDFYTFINISSGGTNIANLYAMWKFKPPLLYDAVASMSKGTQTAEQLQARITAPTSRNRTLDTSNSGVYEYDASVFGAATDASNDYKIYYYRGVLEYSKSTYGSNGSSETYPNYVRLGTTCWRIFRTTGSGGIKMIYNGNWTGSTCANGQTNAQIGTSPFGNSVSSKNYTSGFGYTQNASYNSSNLSAAYSTMFGSNSNYSVNNTNSDIKTYIEGWYNNTSGIKATYGPHLEANAGYCNDRTLYAGTSATTPLGDNTTIATSGYYPSGAYMRNSSQSQVPSLACPRNNADLYTTSTATAGNKQLAQPIALITVDETSFAGSGSSVSEYGSSYHANSFLRSGSIFWLLSPAYRDTKGSAMGFCLRDEGYLNAGGTASGYGVRPVISLVQETIISSGTGVATNPWQVTW